MNRIYNWCQDFEMTLGNAGIDNPEFYEKRIEFCHEFVELLPESDELIIENMRRAEAESYLLIGKLEEGEKAFELLAKDFPNSAWVYIGWGDLYWLFRNNKKLPLDFEKAEKLYRKALTKELDESDKKMLLEKLDDLEEKKKSSVL
jgi:tetratricopeptide (TPR) repeat protein